MTSLQIWVSYALLNASFRPAQRPPYPPLLNAIYSLVPIRPLLYIIVLEKREDGTSF